jgi:hypothetical protein
MIALLNLTDLTNSMDSDRQISISQPIPSSYNQVFAECPGKQQLKSVNFVDEWHTCK